ARHDRLVRRAEHRHRQSHRPAVRPAPGGGLPRLPRPDRPPGRPRPGGPRDLRQPLRPQSAGGAALAAGPPPVRAALHPGLLLLDQPGRAMAGRTAAAMPGAPGVFCSLDELTTALEEWIKLWNENARPFKWTKTP